MTLRIDWSVNPNDVRRRGAPPHIIRVLCPNENGDRYKLLNQLLGQAIACIIGITCLSAELLAQTESAASTQPDIPEEVLRAEIYTDARSPIDGSLLTAAEYVELMEKLRSLDDIPPENFVSPRIREVINSLRLRKFLRQIVPFIP
jgi:hypothetical protein